MSVTSGELHQQFPLDVEWVNLILVAKDMGFSVDDIRTFFMKCLTESSVTGE
jgi:DNA-binding transcriptional MerR regulator